MRRTTIAAAWIAVTGLPALVATVFFFGCCVLPFHRVMHKLMPICQMATEMLQGGHDDQPGDHQPAVPAEAKRDAPQRFSTEIPTLYRLAVASESSALVRTPQTHYRNFLSHGASRCDQDVGLNLLFDTFLI